MAEQTIEQRLRVAARHLDDASRAVAGSHVAYARPVRATPARSSGGGRRPAFLAAAAILVVVAVVGLLALVDEPAPTTVAGPPPTDSEMVVLVADGWSITRHDEADDGSGAYESTYASTAGRLDLHRRVHGYNDEFAHGDPQGSVFGHEVHVLDAGAESRAFWRTENFDFELRGNAGGDASFRSLLLRIRQVDHAGYRAVIDPVVARPEDRPALVAEMLRGVPLPPGFSTDALIAGAVAQDRYQVGARVMGAVACGWIEAWVDAHSRVDATGVAAAAAALESSRGWPTLLEMQVQGAYPEGLWSYAESVVDGTGVPHGKDGTTVEGSYREALGCDR